VSKWLTVTQIISISSNIGAAKIALGLGEQRLYEGLRRFGFGDTTGIPFPGEQMGVLRPHGHPWVQVETATAAYGQGIGVTTLQLAMGMSAIANNGRLLEPVLVKRVSDGTGVTLSEATPHVRRDAIPPYVSELMSEMLVAVTEGEGTGVEAAIPGFKGAGKTGTAQKIDPATHRYSDTHFVASFVGFVPADKPRLTIAVVLDDPMGGTHAGGLVAAPLFRRIGEMALRYLGVTPKGTSPVKLAEVSERAKDRDQARALLGEPRAPEPRASPVAALPARAGEARVPDMTGLPAREAVKTAIGLGLVPSVQGTGRLARQVPPAGTVLPKGSGVTLYFEPPT
jgi:cell division protein FtsI (penicillin-binding protein 3)